MSFDSVLGYAAASFSAVLGLAVMIGQRRSIARWCFTLGMIVLAAEAAFDALTFKSLSVDEVGFWQTLALCARSFGAGIWLLFSLTYSRGNYREFIHRWRLTLGAAFALPVVIGLTIAWHFPLIRVQSSPELLDAGHLWWVMFSVPAKVLNGLLLVAIVLTLMNLERTFRSTVGTMRWRIKFLIVGLGILFSVRFYTRTQVLIFSGYDPGLLSIENGALLIACFLIVAAYFRRGFGEIDVYPSRVVLQTSVTMLLAGSYLFVVGVLARVLAHFGGAANLPIEAFLVLVGIALLAVLLLSERVRQNMRLFVSRHFKRPQHDFRQIWTRFTQDLSAVLDETTLCSTSARLVSEIFNTLSVSVWLLDSRRQHLSCVASTTGSEQDPFSKRVIEITADEFRSLPLFTETKPFDLERVEKNWREDLQKIGAGRFRVGENRIGIPLRAADQTVGLLVLADRVNGVPYTAEEMDLLKCIGDDVAASLLNLRLTRETLERKELEAFQTVSAFFVHDLKNAASTLGLTLQNLPDHFDDPAFREDALRGIKVAADRMNHMISRLSTFRHGLQLRTAEIDLNALIREILKNLNGSSSAEIVIKLDPLPSITADGEQLGSIITNLVLNARDAIGSTGRVTVETKHSGEWVILSVSDNGCGMSSDFVKNSLFRPFHTTKKQGLGVGMFQAKMIVEAHSGNIEVKSEPGAGTTFQVRLPANTGRK